MQLGDARTGKLADNVSGFGRTLRRAGVLVDSARIALAQEAAQLVDLGNRVDLCAAMEAVMVSREEDRKVFRELFDAYFRDPDIAHKLLAQMLPTAEGKAEPSKRRPRVREALAPRKPPLGPPPASKPDQEAQFDAAMTASQIQVLRHADFNMLGAAEYHLVERLARDISLPVPSADSRRTRPGVRGARLHWPGAMRHANRTGGELLVLPRLTRREEVLPLLVLVDVSGSMERYARMLLAFLHAATRRLKGRRDVFAFGTRLTDLTPAFRIADTDEMLAAASAAIDDFGGGTCLGDSLAMLRTQHARRLIGGRTVALVISDGLDTGEPAMLDRELTWLRLHSRRLLWLNPLLRFGGYQPAARGAAVLHRHAHGMLAVHNLSKLEDLAAGLAAVMKN
ncbi:MAG TPA: VWA domain-containing protein [Ramlibacter sp.]|nr:VWA domain-containing protein [Ramlibacter sp.]